MNKKITKRLISWFAIIILALVTYIFVPRFFPKQRNYNGQSGQQKFEVRITDEGFEPKEIEVSPGSWVYWTNEDILPHTVTSEGGFFDSGVLPPSEKFKTNFLRPGEYLYRSAIDSREWGKIIVRSHS